MNGNPNIEPGIFLTLEGDDGVGKSTQANLLATALEACGHEVLRVHEPGGTQLGEKIRGLLLSKEQEGMVPLAELLLYEAARAQVVSDVIGPALAAGKVVICDRFTDSTLAYQGYGRELGDATVRALNDLVCDGCAPDRTFLLVLDPELAHERVIGRSEDGAGDRLESAGEAFHERLRNGFAAIAEEDPGRVRVIDAQGGIEEVHALICAGLSDMFDGLEPQAGA